MRKCDKNMNQNINNWCKKCMAFILTREQKNAIAKYERASFKTKIFKLQSKMNAIRGTIKYFRCKIKHFVGAYCAHDFDSICLFLCCWFFQLLLLSLLLFRRFASAFVFKMFSMINRLSRRV